NEIYAASLEAHSLRAHLLLEVLLWIRLAPFSHRLYKQTALFGSLKPAFYSAILQRVLFFDQINEKVSAVRPLPNPIEVHPDILSLKRHNKIPALMRSTSPHCHISKWIAAVHN